jgi:DNA-binding NarL/FixJ family response regulator
MVANDPRFKVVADAASGEAALALAASIACDLVVMDVRMPGMGGLVAAAELGRLRPDVVVVLVSTSDLPDELTAEVGAIFVPKISLTAKALVQIWAQRHNAHEGGVDHARDR